MSIVVCSCLFMGRSEVSHTNSDRESVEKKKFVPSPDVIFNVHVMSLSMQMDFGLIIMMELGRHAALGKDLMLKRFYFGGFLSLVYTCLDALDFRTCPNMHI